MINVSANILNESLGYLTPDACMDQCVKTATVFYNNNLVWNLIYIMIGMTIILFVFQFRKSLPIVTKIYLNYFSYL